MDKQETEALLQRMSEAAALPPHDPVRIETSRAVVEAGQDFEQQWLNMIAEDERLRLNLLHVDPPAGMRDRLFALPQDADANPALPADGWRMLRMAAVISLLILGSWALFGPRDPAPGTGGQALAQRIDQLGHDALEHVAMHARLPEHIQTVSNDPTALTRELTGKMPFEVHIPDLGKAFKLIGANICKVKHIDVLCTHWLKGDVRYTLVQFCRDQCGLPEVFPKQVVTRDDKPYRPDETAAAVFWSENKSAYALIADSALATAR